MVGSKTQFPSVKSQEFDDGVFDTKWRSWKEEVKGMDDLKTEKARRREMKQRRDRKRKEVEQRDSGFEGFFEVGL